MCENFTLAIPVSKHLPWQEHEVLTRLGVSELFKWSVLLAVPLVVMCTLSLKTFVSRNMKVLDHVSQNGRGPEKYPTEVTC